MRERAEQILKITCLVLAALVLTQVVRAVFFGNPLARVRIPDVPSLPTDTNAPANVKATNTVTSVDAATKGTNTPARSANTNLQITAGSTNLVTNTVATTPVQSTNQTTNIIALAQQGTNVVAQPQPTVVATNPTVNAPPVAGTNPVPGATFAIAGTNLPAHSSLTNSTNAMLMAALKASGSNQPPRGIVMSAAGPAGKRLPDLPPDAKARVYRFVDSEILGQILRPQPMALLGIAGNMAFLRTANGQTGTAKEGESVGDLKLIRIGINRVLVEQEGQQKELTMFSGFGSETLLSTNKEKSDEPTSK